MSVIARLQSLDAELGGRLILNDLSLTIDTNKVTAIIGESGSGKSTLLYSLNGMVTASSGEVEVLGESLATADLVRLRRKIGFAVQDAALMPHFRVYENMTLMARLMGTDEVDMRAHFHVMMELLELDPSLGEVYPHQLSGGQQQRISLGRAFMMKPPLLLLDEPFSAVDPITRLGIYDRFEALLTMDPVSVVMVTHDLKEASRLAENIIVLKDGRLMQAGTLDEVRKAPAQDYVAHLFDAGLS